MASTMNKEGDKAGGEVVFSSDGADPLPIVRPPTLAQHVMHRRSTDNDLVDEEDNFDLHAAFEAFGGSRSHSSITQRLARIERELNSLSIETANDQLLDARVKMLYERLRKQQLQGSMHGINTSEKSNEGVSPAVSPHLDDLEKILLRLENAVGTSTYDNKVGLFERVSMLEKSVKVLDTKYVETVGAKVMVIRNDLEAASKAKSKLQQTGGSDPKVITELYDALQQVTPMQSMLPVLAKRLECLQHQHMQMATWSSRLASLESTVHVLETNVASAVESVDKLESTWIESIAPQLKANLDALDQRIQQLK